MGAPLFFAFDTETGGLFSDKFDLLTIYAGIFDESYNLIEELDLKCKPNDGRLPIAEAGALKVNGINLQEHMANPETIDYRTAGKLLLAMAGRHLSRNGKFSNIRPYGYNILGFDKDWVFQHLMTREEWGKVMHYKDVDIMQEVDALKRRKWLPKEIGSLASVGEFLCIPKRAAHIAKNDILMTIDVDKKLAEIYASKGSGGSGGGDLISLLEQE
jgi:exonuclease I